MDKCLPLGLGKALRMQIIFGKLWLKGDCVVSLIAKKLKLCLTAFKTSNGRSSAECLYENSSKTGHKFAFGSRCGVL